MQGLSYGVVRVDDENSLMSLTLQDCGQVLPGGMLGLCSISFFCFDVKNVSLNLIATNVKSVIWGNATMCPKRDLFQLQ